MNGWWGCCWAHFMARSDGPEQVIWSLALFFRAGNCAFVDFYPVNRDSRTQLVQPEPKK